MQPCFIPTSNLVQEQEQEQEQKQEQGNKAEWKSDYNDVCSPVDDKAQQKFSDFFFFSNWFDLNQTNKQLTKPEQ